VDVLSDTVAANDPRGLRGERNGLPIMRPSKMKALLRDKEWEQGAKWNLEGVSRRNLLADGLCIWRRQLGRAIEAGPAERPRPPPCADL